MTGWQALICKCGHLRADHDEEPPYGCRQLIRWGIRYEDNEFCDCESFEVRGLLVEVLEFRP